MKVYEIMTRNVVTVDMDTTVEEVREIFQNQSFHHLVVTRYDRVAGIISDRDLLDHLSPFIGKRLMERAQDLNTLRKKAHQVMNRHPVVVPPEITVCAAVRLLLEKSVTCLPIVNEDYYLQGIVTWRDLLKHCRFGEADQPSEQAA